MKYSILLKIFINIYFSLFWILTLRYISLYFKRIYFIYELKLNLTPDADTDIYIQ